MSLNAIEEKNFPLASVEFFQQWAIYQTIIRNDYMHHHRITEIFQAQLASLNNKRVSILDLGCGDGYLFSTVARAYPDAQYTGVDMCKTALAIAEQRLEPKIKHARYICSEMQSALTQQTSRYDVILLGFSLHHFQTQDKKVLLGAARQRLKPGGFIFLYDIFQHEQESRESYLSRYFSLVERDWSALTGTEKQKVLTHIDTSDFPESDIFYQGLKQGEGFTEIKQLYRDDRNLHVVYSLR